ncbi:BTAD domain-containing putative transcriptional regulator [Saccharothrix mutabilis subsp. mutabilis]|uniref:BTAD domain-containing putative transcriptional regulator n=1 Tax=Saccharothrix mutabilis subsp. mutabilis TaxID=66855 RepID=A0ABP3D0E3_9PSEU
MEFAVLGPLEVRPGGAPAGRLQRVLLAVLLARANHEVSADALADALWAGRRDPRAPQKLHLHVHKLRRALGEPDRLVFGGTGYRLVVRPGELDAERFEALVARAQEAAGDPERAADLARKALDLWRGEPYDGLDTPAAEARRLHDRRLTAVEVLCEAELARGRNAAVVAELADVVAEHPLRERLHVLLMTALHRAGRRAEALSAYRAARRVLVAELGLEPGAELRRLEQRVLAAEPAEVPSQLPLDVRGFTGRVAELSELDGPAPVTAIVGTAGVGKTALAVRWAHAARDRFPDGRLYLDLRGFGPEPPLPAQEALAVLLRAFGVRSDGVPLDPVARAARLRSVVDGRRVLFVLDNARDAAHVRPLLPGSPTCRVLVTSRDSLAGLVAREGAHRVDVDRLPPADAVGLLRATLGDRVDADPAATAALVERCARLPLALRVAAESVRARRGGTVAGLVADLGPARGRDAPAANLGSVAGLDARAAGLGSVVGLDARAAGLGSVVGLDARAAGLGPASGSDASVADPGRASGLDALDAGGDPVTSVRAVFSWSYRRLPAAAARVFRLVGRPPGPDVDARAVAALGGLPERETRRLLDVLVRAHLVEDTATGRYRLHDLLRAYAAELAEPAPLAPLRAWYLHTAARAVDVLAPFEKARRPEVPAAPGPVVDFPDRAAAHAWLDAERAGILAATVDDPAYAVPVAGVLWRYLDDGGHREDALALHQRALAAGEGVEVLNRVGTALFRLWRNESALDHLTRARALCPPDHPALPSVLNNLALLHSYSGRFAEAVDLLEQSASRTRSHHVLANLGEACRRVGDLARAEEVLEEALRSARESGDGVAESFIACHRAALLSDLGRQAAALVELERALALARSSRSPMVTAEVRYHQGVVSLRMGRVEDAFLFHRKACERAELAGDRRLVAQAHNGLGEAWSATGDRDGAVRHFTLALHVATEIGERHERRRAHAGLAALSAV